MSETFLPIESMSKVRSRSDILKDLEHHLCPGCGEGVAFNVIANVISELELKYSTIAVIGDGCYTIPSAMLDIDKVTALHGRAPAAATGLRRTHEDPVVFTIQGDGDLHGEGVNEAVQAAARGENITVICFNNGITADTGSQMTPASILGQRTNTTIDGRNASQHGHPLRMAELLASLDGTVFSARGSMHSPVEIKRTHGYIRRAFGLQQQRRGFSYVEILTMCPSGWHMSPVEALDFIGNEMSKAHPLGVVKDLGDEPGTLPGSRS